jgi:predicted CXXCH cytochrome family protein
MLATKTPWTSLKPVNYLVAGLFALLVAGCGGDSSGNTDDSATSLSNRTTEIVARTGPIVAVRVGGTALLSDNNSYTTLSQPLSYHWSLVSRPDGSKTVLNNPTSRNPSLVADVRGEYRAQLVVRAGGVSSQRAIQLVVATVAPERLTGPFFHQGLSSSCVSCHNDGFVTIGSKAGDHLATSNTCETCHTPLGFDIVSFVDHQEVSGNCSGCHNGVLAIGKSSFHLPTNGECDSCHNTTSFFALSTDGSFDHTGITSGCAGCHNGTSATGKTPDPGDNPPGTHPVTSADCINCHSTESFQEAFTDHSGPAVVGNRCDSCHGAFSNDNISDPPAGHPTMTRIDSSIIDCGYCHGIATFSLNGIFNHGLVDPAELACESCHNDSNSINAAGKASAVNHLATTTDCGACHNTEAFTPAFGVDHSGPEVVGHRCDECHGVNASGKPADVFSPPPGSMLIDSHMPTAITNPIIPTPPNDRDCADCHTPGTFMTGTFDHDLSFFSPAPVCADCHDNVITLGKLEDHIPTNPATQDCADCHNTTDFTAVTFTHAGIDVNNCGLCHDGNIARGKSLSTHLPTTQNCFVCHNYTDPTFALASSFSHSGINDNCESCHGGNPNYVAVGAIGKKISHIPALTQCDQCHDTLATNAGDFSPAPKFMPDVHFNLTNPISNGCEGCHVSRFLPLPSNPGAELVKDANHVPTAQDCEVCHSNAVGGFTQSSMLLHSGITDNCVSCHNGNFTGVGTIGARAMTPTENDVPPGTHPVTSADCALCHDTISFANAFVDHNDPAVLAVRCDSCHVANGSGTAKGMDAGHVVTSQDCGVCHAAGGSFKPAIFDHSGIVDNCVSCHDGSIATGTAAKTNPPHIPIGNQDCSVCHTPTAFAQATFNHQNITNNCVSCHNGITATGKDNDHVPTIGDCVDCHQTTGFLPATFNHAGIVDNCSSCHATGFATPKIADHVPTTQDCGVCHTTNAFRPATFDHTGISGNCESCHDGNTAKGKIDAVPAHIPTSLDCSSCHTTATFVGGSWTHDASSANNCDTCHDGNIATGKIDAVLPHLSTTEQCDVCHTTNSWAPTSFRHDPLGNYPGDHRRNPGCNGCHGNTISANIPWRWPEYAPFCAACHAGDFEREGDHNGGDNGTVAQNRNCGGSGCHRVSDSGF